ncbi:Methionine adenosyltransferase 2 subunit beta [Heracleum sosnowskyi]|uniref:Methionine adenosyltransferase 2 subunit beta n=1 Tax=Heracleum sosnowskyi TaxID=360622 RepID=A0AAD8I1L7_9APIA|nr:Methionine adenosyltransferase 2 subunit beta [Heracleum sosnowskyi]
MSGKRVLIIGGTGNLPPEPLIKAIHSHCLSFPVDLRNGDGFDAISVSFGQPDVVVNLAALSVPRACEMDPVTAMCVNVPSALVEWLLSFGDNSTLLIHLSTDHVYEGVKSFYKEEDETSPVNVYGRSKLESEHFISANWANFAILRSSIIYGPQTAAPVRKSLPVQWLDSLLAKGREVEFCRDEFRCPIFIKDVVTIIKTLTSRWVSERNNMQLVMNVGGPDRLSRLQMAETVATVRGYKSSLLKPTSASLINRGVKSPADISMDISKLIQMQGFSPMKFEEGVRLTFTNATNTTS